MREIHQRLATVGLRASEEYGFALAGGHALSAQGFGDRPSMDVDLFTNEFSAEQFAEACDRVRQALEEAGFDVADRVRADFFAELAVTERATGEETEMQLGANYRQFPPARIELGPVLDPRDAVAGKIGALYSRGEPRDFIDIQTVLASGRFTREDVLAIGDAHEALPMDRDVLAARFREVQDMAPGRFAPYGVDAERLAVIVEAFTGWADQIDSGRAPAEPGEGR